jgi:hypothetical protein
MKTTEWGVTLGVTEIPEPEFVTAERPQENATVYGWRIDRHGIYVLGDSAAECKAKFISAYLDETGQSANALAF